MPRVVHFEFAAKDPERAAKFYGDVFGWKIEKWQGDFDYWLIMTGDPNEPGIDGGMMKGDVPKTTNTVDVPSIDEYVQKIEANGGKIVMPKSVIPGVGYFAGVEDTEGNLFSIMQNDPDAQG